jgi:hypothetical protein
MNNKSTCVPYVILLSILILASCKDKTTEPSTKSETGIPLDTMAMFDSLTVRYLSCNIWANFMPQIGPPFDTNVIHYSVKLIANNQASTPFIDSLRILPSNVYRVKGDSVVGSVNFKVTWRGRIAVAGIDTISLDQQTPSINAFCNDSLYLIIRFQSRNGQIHQFSTPRIRFLCTY